MPEKKTAKKSNWKDIGDLRMPNLTWRVGNAARWFEKRLGLPERTISFTNPDGSKARSDKTLKVLRKEWVDNKVMKLKL